MKDLFHLPVHFSRQFIALCLALLTLFATPASGQFLSDGVTPVNPIPNSNAILLAHIGNCLAEQPVTGLCTTWGDNSGFGAIPSWDVTNVNDFGNAFLNRTTFNGDLSRWNMINATSLYRMFQNALAFNRDISQWTVSNVRNFDGTFYIAQAFNQDISGWDTSAATDMKNMFQQANAFNQDIRKWTVTAAVDRTHMFLNAPAMTAVYGTHPLYGDTPRREFFYANNSANLENVEFPTEPSVVINFHHTNTNYNVTVPDRASIDIKVRPSEFDNVGHADSTVTIDGSAVLTPDAQGYVTHTVPITTTVGVVQPVPIVVTAPDGVTQRTYTLNLTVNFLQNNNIIAAINNCLAEEPVTGLCVNYSAASGHPVMPNWNVSNVTNFGNAFLNKTTFNGDISQWNMSNATSLYRMFQNALAFNRDISGWTVSNVKNFDGTFYIAQAFNQDISGWDMSAATDMTNMFQQANAFNQDIRKWTVTAAASRTNMFLNAPAMTAVYGTHPLYGDTPRREFFYADNVATLEELAFPNNGLATINFQRNTLNYNVTIFDEKGIEIRVRPTEFDNVGHANASVSIGGSGPLVLDAQGYATHTVPVTMTRANPAQTVSIDVTSPDGTTVLTYTLNLSTRVIDDTNFTNFVNACLVEDPVGGICPNWASGAGLPTMPNWDVSDVTQMNCGFRAQTDLQRRHLEMGHQQCYNYAWDVPTVAKF